MYVCVRVCREEEAPMGTDSCVKCHKCTFDVLSLYRRIIYIIHTCNYIDTPNKKNVPKITSGKNN